MFAAIKKRIQSGRITRAVSQSFFWEVLVAGCTFPASILINRALGAEQRGILAFIILIPSLAFLIATCQWERTVKGWITSQRISSHEAWRMTFYYCWILGVVFILPAIVACFFYDAVPSSMRWLSALYCLNWPLFFLQGCLAAIFLASGKLIAQYQMRIWLQLTYLIVIVALFFFGQVTIFSVVVTYSIMQAAGLLTGMMIKKKNLSGEVSQTRPSLSPLRQSFFPYLIESVSTQADRWAFSFFSTASALGGYVAILALLLPLNLISNALFNGATATLDWRDTHSVRRFLIKSSIFLLLLAGVAIFVGVRIGQPVLHFVLGESFAHASWMIAGVVGIVIAGACGLQFHMSLQLTGRQTAYLTVQVIEHVFRLILVFVLGFYWAEKGIIAGMTISPLLKCVACAFLIFSSDTPKSTSSAEKSDYERGDTELPS
ncbi:MAG: lipopolysaccharide biosynthesis protein [Verrucomicrobiota bacterium]